jgi:hypothetical protein
VAVFGVQSSAEEKYYIQGKPVQFPIPQEQDILSNMESGWSAKLVVHLPLVQTLRLHGLDTSILPYVFMAQCLVKHRGTFTPVQSFSKCVLRRFRLHFKINHNIHVHAHKECNVMLTVNIS